MKLLAFLGLLLVGLGLGCASGAFGPPIVMRNISASLNGQLYYRIPASQAKIGDIALFCARTEKHREHLRLEDFFGACGADHLPILKRWAAASPSFVLVDASGGCWIDGCLALSALSPPSSKWFPVERAGRLRPGELFLLGDKPNSLDSRYLGPVPAPDVLGYYRTLR